MELLIEELGGSVIMLLLGSGVIGVLIAAAATSAFLVLMGNIVLAQGGMLAQLINIWGNSAI